jgi:hypothetical protein
MALFEKGSASMATQVACEWRWVWWPGLVEPEGRPGELPFHHAPPMARGGKRRGGEPKVEKFGPWIGVGPLLDLVEATAPFLFSPAREPSHPAPEGAKRLLDLVPGPDGWWHVLLRAREWLASDHDPSADAIDDYTALCFAAHHATVGTYTPTDVDAKIRGVLWQGVNAEHLRRRWAVVEAWLGWDERLVCTRGEPCGEFGRIGGHDGERLGVMAGAYGAALTVGEEAVAEAARLALTFEVDREANALRQAIAAIAAGNGDPIALLRLAWVATHNVGDINQGLSFWPEDELHTQAAAPFARLAHENAGASGGAFLAAKRLYHLVEAEGHRNYSLRQARCLRMHPDLLLPLGPCLEAWGERVARHRKLDAKDHVEVIAALVEGARKVPGQVGRNLRPTL